MFTVELFTVIK